MKSITRRTYIVIFLVVAFFAGLGFMLYSFYTEGSVWVASKANNHIYSNGVLTVAGTVYDRNGKVLVSTVDGERVYNESLAVRRSTLHVVGDASGFIATGVQTLYKSTLIGYSFLGGIYGSDTNDMKLTIDADVSATAYNAMNGNKGTVIVYNYQTGEIITMVSAPNYDPKNKPQDIDTDTSGKYDGIYLNRAISGVFTPGSTFKVVTAICAIENIPGVTERTFKCTGKYTTGDGKGDGDVICNGTHGTLTFERALNVSCNSVFSQLAVELGGEKLTRTVRELGFNKSVSFGKISTVKSTFSLSGSTNLDIGWAGIGQYTTLINPLQMLTFMGAIANSGTAVNPYLVEDDSVVSAIKGSLNTNVNINAETATLMRDLLRSNVKNYYGDSKFPGLEMCGKTGTAEVAGEKSHGWFVGFSYDTNFPYAIVVCLENGGNALYNAVPVANKVMQAVAKMK